MIALYSASSLPSPLISVDPPRNRLAAHRGERFSKRGDAALQPRVGLSFGLHCQRLIQRESDTNPNRLMHQDRPCMVHLPED